MAKKKQFKKIVKKISKISNKGIDVIGKKNIIKGTATAGGFIGKQLYGKDGKTAGKKLGKLVAKSTIKSIKKTKK